MPSTLQLTPSMVPQSFNHTVNVQERLIRIAVSGCTSSGKTSLCYLLAAVFSGTSSELKLLDAGNDIIAPQKKGQPITKTVILHQDSYFRPKHECQVVGWNELHPQLTDYRTTEPRNAETIERYVAGIRMDKDSNKGLDFPSARNAEVNSGVVCEKMLEIPMMQTVSEPVFISKQSPHTDCKEAINFQCLWQELHNLSNGGCARRCVLEESFQESIKVEECVEHVERDLVCKLQQRVGQWVKREAEHNARIGFRGVHVINGKLKDILLLEGFLLFVLDDSDGEWAQCMEDLDVKLFLATTKATSFRRRFQRPEYIDAPMGMRQEHQPWRSEGYFHCVAWPEYEKEHSWLFRSGNVQDPELKISKTCREKRINMRPKMDAGFEFSLEWAIDTILLELGESERAGRETWMARNNFL